MDRGIFIDDNPFFEREESTPRERARTKKAIYDLTFFEREEKRKREKAERQKEELLEDYGETRKAKRRVKSITHPLAERCDDLRPLESLAPSSRRVIESQIKKFQKEVGVKRENETEEEYYWRLVDWINEPKSVSARRIRRNVVLRCTGQSIEYDYVTVQRGRRQKTIRRQRYEPEDFEGLLRRLGSLGAITPEEITIATLAWYVGARSCEIPHIRVKRSKGRTYLDIPAAKGSRKRNIEVTEKYTQDPLFHAVIRHITQNPLTDRDVKRARDRWLRRLEKVGEDSTRWSFHSMRHAFVTRKRDELIRDYISSHRDELREELSQAHTKAEVMEVFFKARENIETQLSKITGHRSIRSVRRYGFSGLFSALMQLKRGK